MWNVFGLLQKIPVSSLMALLAITTASCEFSVNNGFLGYDNTIKFTFAKQQVSESVGVLTVGLQLNKEMAKGGGNVSLEIQPLDGVRPATQGSDFIAPTLDIPVTDGAESIIIVMPVFDDTNFENQEGFKIKIANVKNMEIGDIEEQEVLIMDNDPAPSVEFSSASQSVLENAGSASVTIDLTGATEIDTVIPYTISGTASSSDISIASGSITIPAGSVSGIISGAINNDIFDELDETLIITLGTPNGADLGSTTVHTITIQDDDATPSVTFAAAANASLENAGAVSVAVNLSAASGLDVTIPYSVSGTAGNPDDMNLGSGTLLIPAGSTSGSISFSIVDDLVDEPDETVILTMGTLTNAVPGANTVHTHTITDNDIAPVANFSSSTQSVSETSGTVTVTVNLTGTSSSAITIPYTVAGTAAQPADHDLVAGNLVIPALGTSGSITINLVDDSISESTESIVITMGSPTNATLGTTTSHTVAILDDEGLPVANFSASSQSFNEASGVATITVVLSNPSSVDIDIPFTLSGTGVNPDDYSSTSSPLTITAGNTSGNISLTVVDDVMDEPDETVVLTMGIPTNAAQGSTNVHTLTIQDNDAPSTVDFASATQSVAEGVGTVTVSANLDRASAYNVTVPFTVSGTANNPEDHDLVAGNIVISAGSTFDSVSFSVVDDTRFENDETVIVTMGTPTNGTAGTISVHTVTITNDDAQSVVEFSAASQTVAESVGTVTVTASLDKVSGTNVILPFAVSGTTTATDDHDLVDGSITILAGSLTANQTFDVVDDLIDENDETVVLTAGSPTDASLGTTTIHTVTVTDNDAAPLVSFSSASQSVNENVGSFTISVEIDAVSGLDVTIPYTVSGSSVSPADHDLGDGSVVITAGNTSATLTVNVVDDSLYELNETLVVAIGTPTNGTTGAPATHTATINDNESAPTVAFNSSSQSASESAGAVSIQVDLSSVSGLNVTVPYTISGTANGSDHDLVDGSLVISAGSSNDTIDFNITDDLLFESAETIIVSIGTPTNSTLGSPSTHTFTINDNDATPEVDFTVASQSASEGAGTMTITAQLNAVSGLDVTLPFTVTGTASNPSDYGLTSSPITITAGSTSADITITIIDDSLYENDETVIVTMGTPTNANAGTVSVHTATITNDETAPTITFTSSAQSSDEADGTAIITAQLSAVSGLDVTLPFTFSGTAADPADFSSTSSPVTITAGSTSTDITITIVDDALDENDETVIVSMGSPTNASLGGTTSHTLTINDNDAAPSVQFSAATQSVGEAVGTVTVTLQLDAASGLSVTVPYTVSGSASNPADHDLASGSLVISAGATSDNFTFDVVDDLISEGNENVIVTIGTPTNATKGSTDVQTITITDNEGVPVADFSSATQSVGEAVGTVTVTANLDVASSSIISVPFTISGTATNPADHDAAAGSITIAAGNLSGSTTFDVVDDTINEVTETVIYTMGTPTGASAGTVTTQTISISDNDGPPVVQWSVASQSVSEGAATATITAQLDKVSGQNVTVPYTITGTATNPADYSNTVSPIVINSGSLTQTVTITINDDALDENDETVVVTIGSPTNATLGSTSAHTLTIQDNDVTPTVDFTVASQSGAENAGNMTVTAQLSAVSGLDVSVPFTLSGTATSGAGNDYTITASPITISAGSTTQVITITVNNDATDEDDETVIVTMGSPTNGTVGTTTVHTATITDDDAAPSLTFSSASQSVGEAAGTATITATLSAASEKTITMPFSLTGTAVDPDDYSVTASPIVFSPGDTSKDITVTIVDDALDETNETVIATMGALTNATTGATTAHTLTINDNDATPTVTFTTASQSGLEGGSDFTITAQLSAVSGQDVDVPFSLTGTADDPDDYSITGSPITISAGGTTATITITLADDALDEDNETVIVTMGSPTNATQGAITVHTATITDDDATPTVTFTASSQSGAENGSDLTVTAQLSAVSGRDVTVPFTITGTALDPDDFSVTASPITITAGTSSEDITIALVNDALDEDDETVIVTMGTPTNATQGGVTVHTATITDDDATPSISFAAGTQSVSEGAATATITLQLSAVSGRDVSVPFSMTGTAADPDDYSITSSPVTISAGSSSTTLTVSISDDSIDEPNETVIASMGTPTNASLGATTVHTLTITDNDATVIADFSASVQNPGEGAGTITVTVSLSGQSSQVVTVPFTVSGTAANPADHDASSGNFVFAALETSKNYTFDIVDDALTEGSETVIFSMGTPTNADAGTVTTHTVTIADNDGPPEVNFTVASQSASEGSGTMTITAQLSSLSASSVTVPFTLSGTAVSGAGNDYTISSTPITIAAGNWSEDITITIVDDSIDEDDETVVVTMGTPTNATKGSTDVHTATIQDDDDGPVVQLATASQSELENIGTMTVIASLSSASGKTITLPYTLSGTATEGAGNDYTITASPLTFTAGQTSKTITITVNDDSIDEDDQTVIITLGTPTNATKGATDVHTATIQDDDAAPTISFSAATQSATEDAGSFTISAALSSISEKAVSLPFALSGTATEGAGSDYTISSSPLSISAGSSSANITVTVNDDALYESSETVIVTMGSPTNASLGTTTVHTATITDNDSSPDVDFTVTSQSGSESSGTMTITAQLSAVSGQNVSVPFTLSGTATQGGGADYTITASPVTITAGTTTANIVISINDDSLDESDETVIVTMGTPTNANQGSANVHTATITDNDATPTVAFTASSQSELEDIGTMTITVQLSAISGQDVSVPFTLSGTATEGASKDYTISASPLTISAGATSADITITVNDDSNDENDQTVIVTMGSPTNASQGATTVHTATIQDNDAEPTITFAAASQSGAESVGTMTITANVSVASEKAISVPFTIGGTATEGAGNDFTISSSPLSISAESTSASITITVNDDSLYEPSETVIVTMGSPTNATQGATTVHTATITDDDGVPTVSFTASTQSGSEGAGTLTITAQLSAVSGQNVTVPFTLSGTATEGAGSDYTITASPLTITAGSSSANIVVTINDDSLDENDETVIVTMGSPTNATQGGTTVHTATITDNDAEPSVTFTTASQSGAESVGTMTITAQLSAASGKNIDVPFALSGTASEGAGNDYTITSSPISISAGATTQSIVISVIDDSVDEDDQTVIVTMGSPTNAIQGATTVHTATITDDDAAPTVNWSAASQSGSENSGTLTVTASLSSASEKAISIPFTLSGTATEGAGNDYTISASPISISAGSSSGTATITINDDSLDEGDETVILTMGSPTNAIQGATTVHTATITDDDATPTVTFTAASQSGAENVGTMTITAQLSAASGQDVSIPFTLGGTATEGVSDDYTITASPLSITAGGTTATITITVNDDAFDEPNETVVVTMGSPTNATQGATTVHTATINDDDATPTVTFTAASQSGAENVGTMTITAQLSAASGQDVSIPFTLGGTATEGVSDDYTITASPLSITAGGTTATITITINDDTKDELDQTVIVTMGTPTNASQGATTVHTATITDDDAAPSVAWSVSSQAADEDVGTMTVTGTLSAVSEKAISVPFSLTGTATEGAGEDFTISTTPLSIPAGASSGNITITVNDDSKDEPNETVIVTMGSPTNATQGATTVHTATINDNDTAPTVAWTTASQSAGEGSGTMTVTAQLSAASGYAITVPFSVTGTATSGAGNDYTITASPLSISAGSTTASATITINDDAITETAETIILTMGSPTNATQGATTVHTATINDNESLPEVNFTASTQSAGEGAGSITITAQLSTLSASDVDVPFTIGGTAQEGGGLDFTISSSPITISAGNSTQTITVTINDDSIDENDETIIVTMGTPTNASQGSTNVHTVTITDNDAAPSVAFSASSQSDAESAGSITVTAQLSAVSGKDVTVPFTLSGTATEGAGQDYTITSSPVTITAGATSTDITVTINDDSLDENDETVIVTMGSPTNATQGATTVHTATITDNDAEPSVTFTAASQSGAENSGTMTITAQLSAVSGRDVSVPFTVSGTATEGGGDDFTITSSPVPISEGSSSVSITITINNDSLDEDDETVVVTMGTPTNASQGATTVHTATITDDDAEPTVTFTAASQSGSENSGTLTVTAQLSATSTKSISVPFTLSGTATEGAGEDYTISSSPITISPGSSSGTITITINDDSIDEDDETVIVTMGSPTNATQGATTVHTATITDDDAAPSVTFTASTQTGAESVGTMTITAQLSGESGKSVSVPFTLSGTATEGASDDYTISSTPISISAGSLTGTITITVADDAIDEDDENVVVTMGSPTNASQGATTVHTATITDNDSEPSVTFTAASQSGAESVGTMTITAQLSGESSKTVSVPFTLGGTATEGAGQDYTISSTPVSISAGSLTGTITITVNDDSVNEGSETVVVTMGTPTNASQGATTVHTATITDNDSQPTVTFTAASQSGAESVGTMTITAQLSSTSGQNVTVPFTLSGTATEGGGDDFTITSSPVTINSGSTTATITITVNDDSIDELDETVIVTMGTPTNAAQGATTVHTATITDNDATPTVAFTAASQSGAESIGTMTITAQLSGLSSQDVSVPYTLSGTATEGAGQDYTITASPISITAGSSSATITITVNDDSIDEADETVIVTMGTPTNASQGATTVHTATITDNDATPSVTFTAASQSGAESVGTMTVTAQLSAVSGQSVSIPFTLSGTATEGAGQDYTITASPVSITAGSSSATITITVNDDALDELDETVIVTMGTPTNASQGATTVHTATITDNDATPSVQFAAVSQSGSEDDGSMSITLQLSAASGLDVSVPFTLSGTATQGGGQDYTLTASPATITAGSTSVVLTLTVNDDSLDESDETVILTMGSPTNATQGTNTVHTATILDNDSMPSVTFAASTTSQSEDTTSVMVTLNLSAASGQDVDIPFTVTGTATDSNDYTVSTSPATIPAGSTTVDIQVDVIEDTLYENDETVILTMGTPTNASQGATTVHTVTITNDDAVPVIDFTAASQSAAESVGTMTITASIPTASGLDVTLPFSVGGDATPTDDYSITSSPITITAGSTSANITITVVDDTKDEPNQVVTVSMSTPTNATLGTTTVHNATINDNDNPPIVKLSVSSWFYGENIGSATVATVYIEGGAANASEFTISLPFTVGSGTATPTTDYTLSASPMTLNAGETTVGATLTVVDDALYESMETFILNFGTPTNATWQNTTTFTGYITNNDTAPTINFGDGSDKGDKGDPIAISVAEGDSGSTEVEIMASIDAVAGVDVSLSSTVGDGSTATDGVDFSCDGGSISITIPAGSTTGSTTCEVNGDTLDEVNETFSFKLADVTNAALGETDTVIVTITDDDTDPPVFVGYATDPVTYKQNILASSNMPSVTSTDPVTGYSAIDTLPTGLTLNTSNGGISGFASTRQPSSAYTIQVSNAGGSDTTELDIAVDYSFTVSEFGADLGDVFPGNGACAASDGKCYLRTAIEESNSYLYAQSIKVNAGTVSLTAGSHLGITTDIEIVGSGEASTFLTRGSGTNRLIFVSTSGSFSMSEITLQNVSVSAIAGGCLAGNSGSVTFENMTVKNCTTTDQNGGGLWFSNTNLIADSVTFDSNAAYYATTLGTGGGLSLGVNTNFEIYDSVFQNNVADQNGAGLSINGDPSLDEGILQGTTFYNNSAGSQGGAMTVYNRPISISNSTFYSNSSASGGTAMVFSGGTIANMFNSTVFGNYGVSGGTTTTEPGVVTSNTAQLTAYNSIMANNLQEDGSVVNNCATWVTSSMYGAGYGNITDSPIADCAGGTSGTGIVGSGDLYSTDPDLGSFQNNGGKGSTLMPNVSSPAVSGGYNAACTATDQAGSAQTNPCTIGAKIYELPPPD